MESVPAAGGVLWRPTDGSEPAVEIAVIHRPRHGDWSLPKGKLDQGETWTDAAAREVFEETGYRVRIGARLGEVTYPKTAPDGSPGRKVVRYWAMEAVDGAFSPDEEVDALEWLPPAEARERLSYDRDRGVLDAFLRSWPAVGATAPTVP